MSLAACALPLIEPYGIEIAYLLGQWFSFATPLIEPYGIEICFLSRFEDTTIEPLIEPYGIEITKLVHQRIKMFIL